MQTNEDQFWDKQRELYPVRKHRPLEINIPCNDDNINDILSIFVNPTSWTYENEKGKYVVVIFDFKTKWQHVRDKLSDMGINMKDVFETGGFQW